MNLYTPTCELGTIRVPTAADHSRRRSVDRLEEQDARLYPSGLTLRQDSGKEQEPRKHLEPAAPQRRSKQFRQHGAKPCDHGQ